MAAANPHKGHWQRSRTLRENLKLPQVCQHARSAASPVSDWSQSAHLRCRSCSRASTWSLPCWTRQTRPGTACCPGTCSRSMQVRCSAVGAAFHGIRLAEPPSKLEGTGTGPGPTAGLVRWHACRQKEGRQRRPGAAVCAAAHLHRQPAGCRGVAAGAPAAPQPGRPRPCAPAPAARLHRLCPPARAASPVRPRPSGQPALLPRCPQASMAHTLQSHPACRCRDARSSSRNV